MGYYILDEHLELNKETAGDADVAIFREGDEDADPVVTIHKIVDNWPEVAKTVLDGLNRASN